MTTSKMLRSGTFSRKAIRALRASLRPESDAARSARVLAAPSFPRKTIKALRASLAR
jgi:hypothetical protein